MKKSFGVIGLLGVIACGALGQSTLLRGPTTTTALTRQMLTNETAAGVRGAIGLSGNGGGGAFNASQFSLGAEVSIADGALGTNWNLNGVTVTNFLRLTNGNLLVDSNASVINPDGRGWNFRSASNAQTVATLGMVSNVVLSLPGSGTGSVTSVGLSAPAALFNNPVIGSPVTSSGVLSLGLANQNPATVLAGPVSGSPSAPIFRKLTVDDLTNNFYDGTVISNTTAYEELGRYNPVPFAYYDAFNDFPNTMTNWTLSWLVGRLNHFATNGFLSSGFVTMVDMADSWMATNYAGDGSLTIDPVKFPATTLRACTDLIRSKGFKAAVYTSYSDNTCLGRPASPGSKIYQHVYNLGVGDHADYIILDRCNGTLTASAKDYNEVMKRVYNAVLDTGRPMGFSFLVPPEGTTQNYWRNRWEESTMVPNRVGTIGEIFDYATVTNVMGRVKRDVAYEPANAIRPGHFLLYTGWYPDGDPRTPKQARDQFTGIVLMSACMQIGSLNDGYETNWNQYGQNPSDTMIGAYTNLEVNAIWKDVGVNPPYLGLAYSAVEYWLKPLGDARASNSFALAIAAYANGGKTSVTNSIDFSFMGLPSSSVVLVRDVWAQTNVGYFSVQGVVNWTNAVPTNTLSLYRVTVYSAAPTIVSGYFQTIDKYFLSHPQWPFFDDQWAFYSPDKATATLDLYSGGNYSRALTLSNTAGNLSIDYGLANWGSVIFGKGKPPTSVYSSNINVFSGSAFFTVTNNTAYGGTSNLLVKAVGGNSGSITIQFDNGIDAGGDGAMIEFNPTIHGGKSAFIWGSQHDMVIESGRDASSTASIQLGSTGAYHDEIHIQGDSPYGTIFGYSKPLDFTLNYSDGTSPHAKYPSIQGVAFSTNSTGDWGIEFASGPTTETFSTWTGSTWDKGRKWLQVGEQVRFLGSNGVAVAGSVIATNGFSAAGGSIMLATNAVSNWPTAASWPGACAFVNSNATVYLLTSTPGGTAWNKTNLIAGP